MEKTYPLYYLPVRILVGHLTHNRLIDLGNDAVDDYGRLFNGSLHRRFMAVLSLATFTPALAAREKILSPKKFVCD